MKTPLYILGCWTLLIGSTLAQISTGVRLVGGSDKCRGQLEIMTGSNTYNPACSNIVRDNEAKVICKTIPNCPSEKARIVSVNNFDLPTGTNSTSYPFVYICTGNELDLSSCYQSIAQVCGNSLSNAGNIAIECDPRHEVNILLVVVIVIIVVVFVSLPIITYSCIKFFEWIDNR